MLYRYAIENLTMKCFIREIDKKQNKTENRLQNVLPKDPKYYNLACNYNDDQFVWKGLLRALGQQQKSLENADFLKEYCAERLVNDWWNDTVFCQIPVF